MPIWQRMNNILPKKKHETNSGNFEAKKPRHFDPFIFSIKGIPSPLNIPTPILAPAICMLHIGKAHMHAQRLELHTAQNAVFAWAQADWASGDQFLVNAQLYLR